MIPFTLGMSLILLWPMLRPQAVTHFCRRCGLRLGVVRVGDDDRGFTIPMDVDDYYFIPAPEHWRPHLARLPGGMRVAKSPLGLPPEITEHEMKACNTRFVKSQPLRKLWLLADDRVDNSVKCILDDSTDGRDDVNGAAEVLYEIHASGVRGIKYPDAPDAHIKVQMRSPPAEDVAADGLPPYNRDPTNATLEQSASSTGAQVFTEACRYQLLTNEKRKYSSLMFVSSASGRDEDVYVYLNTVPPRFRGMFLAFKPVWRWYSSQGGLLWMSRRYRDAEMTAMDQHLCLVDDYDRLLAVVAEWDGLLSLCAVDDPFAQSVLNGRGPRSKASSIKLYADLSAQLLGEILGSLAVLGVQIKRVTAEFLKEIDERQRNEKRIK